MPVSIVHKTSANNKGSCSKYGFYLNKENEEYTKMEQPERQQYFFNQTENKISTVNAIATVDDNNKGKGLKKNQDKYFTLTLNFSHKELQFLAEKASGKKINNVDELNIEQYKKYNEAIREYAREAMNNYSDNFKRNISKNDIAWFAKVEHRRRFKGTDKEVEKGKVNSGELKPGLNSHVHITVSRMHKEYRTSLSPLANSRFSTNKTLNGKQVTSGFDRSNWKQLNEDSFDKMFNYERDIEEKFETMRILKNGSLQEKQAMKQDIERLQKQQLKRENDNEISY